MSQTKTLIAINELLSKVENDVKQDSQSLQASEKVVKHILTGFFLIVGLTTLFNMYFLYSWGQEVKESVYEIEGLYQHINSMKNQMVSINTTVSSLAEQTTLISVMDEEMSKFINNMTEMAQEMHTMDTNMMELNQSLGGISEDVGTMTGEVDTLSTEMKQMNTNIHEFSRMMP